LGESNAHKHYEVYRDSNVRQGQIEKLQGATASGDQPMHFVGDQNMSNLEHQARKENLQFIEELVFENGAVYKGKCDLAVLTSSNFLQVIYSKVSVMDPELKSGLMVLSTRANGERTRQTARVSSGMPTAMSMKASGKTTRQMDLASTSMSMAQSMKVSGRTISKTETVSKAGPMAPNTKVAIRKE
jgi:hypothetical protein